MWKSVKFPIAQGHSFVFVHFIRTIHKIKWYSIRMRHHCNPKMNHSIWMNKTKWWSTHWQEITLLHHHQHCIGKNVVKIIHGAKNMEKRRINRILRTAIRVCCRCISTTDCWMKQWPTFRLTCCILHVHEKFRTCARKVTSIYLTWWHSINSWLERRREKRTCALVRTHGIGCNIMKSIAAGQCNLLDCIPI